MRFNRQKQDSSSDLKIKHKILPKEIFLKNKSCVYLWKYQINLLPAYSGPNTIATARMKYHSRPMKLYKNVITKNNWTFEISSSGDSTPTHIILSFQARNKFDAQSQNNSTFDQLSVSVCKMGPDKYADDGIECDYDRDNYHQAYHEVVNFFKLHSQTNLVNLFISLGKFRTEYNFYVFDLSKQKPTMTYQTFRLEFKFSAAFAVTEYAAYALVLTPEVISFSSEG